MHQSHEEDILIDLKMIKNKIIRERNARDDFDTGRKLDLDLDLRKKRHSDRHSPPLSSNRSRHSSLSNRSNHDVFEWSDQENTRKKAGSRLSFADELESAKSHKHAAPDSPLKNMLKGELTRARSSESLRGLKEHNVDKDLHERDSSRSTIFFFC